MAGAGDEDQHQRLIRPHDNAKAFSTFAGTAPTNVFIGVIAYQLNLIHTTIT
jgi:hypothetical protein